MRRVALALVIVALAACGGGSGRLSQAEFMKRATAICTQQANAVLLIPRGPANATNATGYLGAVLSVVEKGVRQFHALKPPADKQTQYDAFLAALDHNVNVLRTLRAAAAAQQRKEYIVGLAALHRSRLRINRTERQLGLTGCLSSG